MNAFYYSEAAQKFIATDDSRETSADIMRAITVFARSISEAEEILDNGLNGWDDNSAVAFVNCVTGDGQRGEPSDYVWGAAGDNWLPASIKHYWADQ